MSLFSVEDVEFKSSTGTIINGISLSIEKGSVTGFIGKSGCGKSTLLKLIAGILVPSGGQVKFMGRDIQEMNDVMNKAFRKRCGFVFQDSALWANQSIRQNLELPLYTYNQSLSPKERLEKINELCSYLGYERSLDLRPVDLSMGEQKRIAVARALICKPEILFLDECIESLDSKGGRKIVEFLQNFINNNGTVLYVSHNATFISAIGGKIIELDEGKILKREE